MDRLTAVKIKLDNDSTYSSEIPIGVLAENIALKSGKSLEKTIEDIQAGIASSQSDWNQEDPLHLGYIENKPAIKAGQAEDGSSIAQGVFKTNIASDSGSHAEGSFTAATGAQSHTEGYGHTIDILLTGDGNTLSYKYSHQTTTVVNTITKQISNYIQNHGVVKIIDVGDFNINSFNQNDSAYYKSVNITAIDSTNKTITVDATLSEEAISKKKYYLALYTTASEVGAHAEGESTIAFAKSGHAEGQNTIAKGYGAHVEGRNSMAIGNAAHAEGQNTKAERQSSHAEGSSTKASGNNSHAEGESSVASGAISHAEGVYTVASGSYSHAEGMSTTASASQSHAEGASTVASGVVSHAEGVSTVASGDFSHAEGGSTAASGEYAHAEGANTIASGQYSHAEGKGTVAASTNQHVQGKYNVEDAQNIYAHIVGNGTDKDNRSNAHTLDWSGNAWYAGKVTAEGTPTEDNDLTPKSYVDNTLPTGTASGSVATFIDGADNLPIQSLVVNIEPKQDLHGYDSPWVGGGGKNLVDIDSPESEGYYNVNGTHSTSNAFYCYKIPVKSNTNYTYSGNFAGITTFWDADMNFISGINQGYGFSKTFTTPENCAFIRKSIDKSNIDGTQMIEVGSTATDYAPYANICPIEGWTGCEVVQTGKNLIPKGIKSVGKFKPTGGVISGSVYNTVYFPVPKGMLYWKTLPPSTPYVCLLDDIPASGVSTYETKTTTNLARSVFDNTVGHKYMALFGSDMGETPESAFEFVVEHEMCVTCNDYADFEEPVASTILPISWESEAGTVYGGVLDVLSGKLTVNMTYLNLDEIEWMFQDAVHSWFIELNKLPVLLKQPANDAIPLVDVEGKCSTATVRSYSGTTTANSGVIYNNNSIGIRASVARLYFRTDGTNGVRPSGEAVLPMATPIEVQLTPNEVNSLLGINNIFADTGDVSVEYKADTQLYIDKNVGVDLSDYITRTDYANTTKAGAIKVSDTFGNGVNSDGVLYTIKATDSEVKTGTNTYKPITPSSQHTSVFYGLAKASGDTTQASSTNAIGTYTSEAKTKIKTMLDIPTKTSELTNDSNFIEYPSETGTEGQVLGLNSQGNLAWTDLPDTPTTVVGELSDLTDISIASVENGQILKYNNTSQKWENKTPTWAEITEVASGNLFNPDNIITTTMFMPNGTTFSWDGFCEYMPIEAGFYTFLMPHDVYSGNTGSVPLFDANKTFIKTLRGTTAEYSTTHTAVTLTITEADITEGCAYFGFSDITSQLNTAMVVKGTTYPDSYIAPGTIRTIDGLQIYQSQIIDLNTAIFNPLNGKKASFNGDSICFGAGYAGGYAAIIGQENNMVIENVSVSGATVAPVEGVSHCISTSIDTMSLDADYVILEGGVNDADRSVPIGTLTSGYEDTLDTTTFAGAFENMLKSAITRFPDKKLGYIFIHKCGNFNQEYYNVAKTACEKWGVPYCDLNTKTPPIGRITALATAFTSNADGYHPNEAGYRVHYVPKITAWMKTL